MRPALTFLLLSSVALADTHIDALGFTAVAGEGGVQVAAVDPGGFAEKGGLQKGDVIAKVDEQPVATPEQLLRAMPRFATEVRLQVVRSGAAQALILPLAAPPQVPPHQLPPLPPDRPNPPQAPPNPPPAAPANVLPFLISDRGFLPGKSTWKIDRICKGPVSQPIASPDARSLAWVSPQGTLGVWQDGKASEVQLPGAALLLGFLTPSEVAFSTNAKQPVEVDAIDVKTSQVRTLFSGDHAEELFPRASCIVGYVPASSVFARVIVGKPVCTVDFYKTDGSRFGTLQPFQGSIVSAYFASGAVLVVKGTPPSTAGEVFPAIPGMTRQGSTGVSVPDLLGGRFAFSPNGRYALATAQGPHGGKTVLIDGGAGETKTVFEESMFVPLAWPSPETVFLVSEEGLLRLSLVPRDPPHLAAEAKASEAAGALDAAEAVWRELAASFPQSEEAEAARTWIEVRERQKIDERVRGIQEEAERLAKVERYEDAIAQLESIRAQFPSHPGAAAALGRIQEMQGLIAERERRKRDARIAALLDQARETAGTGHLEESIQQYQAIRAEFPGLPCDRAAAEQIAAIEKQVEEQKRAELAKLQAGLAAEAETFASAGEIEKAIEQLEEIRKRWPGTEPSQAAAKRIAALETKLKETKAAEFAARMKKRLEVAQQLASQGDLARAREETQSVVAADPENGDAKLMLSDIDKKAAEVAERERAAKVQDRLAATKALLDAGDLDGAEAGYKAVIEVNPQNEEARAGLVRVASSRREKKVAEEVASSQKALVAGQYDAARDGFQRALALDPRNQDAAVGLLQAEKAIEKAKQPPSDQKMPQLPPENPPSSPLPPLPPLPPEDAGATTAIHDFVGVEGAKLQDDAPAVEKALGKPDQRKKAGEEGRTQWTWAAKGIEVILDDESGKVVGVCAIGAPGLVTADLRAKLHAFSGKTEKGVAMGAGEDVITGAYGPPKAVSASEEGKTLVYEKDSSEMSFYVERSKLVKIDIRQVKK